MITLDKYPDAVSRARHFIDEVLAEAPATTVADAGLVVTELVTNALLHGHPPVTVRVMPHDSYIRVEVHDREHRPPVRMGGALEAMTGRGLALVAAVSSSWGIEEDAEGKLVWAEIAVNGGSDGTAHTAVNGRAVLDFTDPVYTVELGEVPTELLLEAMTHVDNFVRELVLVWSRETPKPWWLTALLQSVEHDFADARTQIKTQAFAAAARDAATTDLVLRVPASAAAAGARFLVTLDEAESQAHASRLLTLDAPPVHRAFRHWYVEELAHQLSQLAAGEAPDQARSFADAASETYRHSGRGPTPPARGRRRCARGGGGAPPHRRPSRAPARARRRRSARRGPWCPTRTRCGARRRCCRRIAPACRPASRAAC